MSKGVPLTKPQIEVLKYLVAGGINTVFAYGVYAVVLWVGLSYVVAALVAQVLGTTFNYFTYSLFVFKQAPQKGNIIRFVMQYGLSYLVTLALLTGLQALGMNAYTAGLVNLLVIPVLTYFSNKYFVFKNKNEATNA